MLRRIRTLRFFSWFWLLMALYLFNISADAPDASSAGVHENLAYNDVETVVEWALEDMLGIENAIPEHDDPDREDGESSSAKYAAQPNGLPESPISWLKICVAGKASLLQSDRLLKPGRKPEVPSLPPQAVIAHC